MDDLGKVGERLLGLNVQHQGEAEVTADVDLLPLKRRSHPDHLGVGSVGRGGGAGHVVDGGVGPHPQGHQGAGALALSVLWGPDGDGVLAVLHGDLGAQRQGDVEGSVHSRAQELASEGADHVGSDGLLVVDDGLHGQANTSLGHALQVNVEGGLAGHDQRSGMVEVQGETSLGGDDSPVANQVDDLDELLGQAVVLVERLHGVPGHCLDDLFDHGSVNGEEPLETQDLDRHVCRGWDGNPVLDPKDVPDVVLVGIVLRLVLSGHHGVVGLVRLVEEVLGALDVHGRFDIFHPVGFGLHGLLPEPVLGDDGLGSVDVLQLKVDRSLQVVKELEDHVVPAGLPSKVALWLCKLQGLPGLLADVGVGVAVVGQLSDVLQGGVDVGDHLQAGVEPGADGKLVPDLRGGPGVGQDSDGGHADLSRLGHVVDDVEEDWPVDGGLGSSGPHQLVDGDGADVGVPGQLAFDHLQEVEGSGVVSQVSEGVHVGDDVVGVVLSRGKELLSQEGDEVPDDEGALAVAEPAVDLGWEVVDRGGLVDARLVDPLGEGEGNGGHVGVALAMDELEDGDEFVHQLDGGGLDVADGVGHNPGSSLAAHPSGLHVLDEESHAGVGGGHGDEVQEGVVMVSPDLGRHPRLYLSVQVLDVLQSKAGQGPDDDQG